ncbi:hypothetical protein BDV93DRAFT_514233 [Ceratobasidium sp. AG-I]|nr:hypothetical protein BDV93DRAFT_514233 [Ceratobasidium sp. AG-I]
MPKSRWTKEESQFLKQHADEWQQLQLDYSSRNKKVGSDDPLNSFISDLVNTFYERFPERDIDQCPESETLFDQEERDSFQLFQHAGSALCVAHCVYASIIGITAHQLTDDPTVDSSNVAQSLPMLKPGV